MNLFEYIDVMNTPYQIYKEEVKDAGFMVKGHWHYFIEILLLTQGKISVDCGNYQYLLAEGEVIVLPPKLLHRIHAAGEFPSRYVVVKFDMNTIKIPGVYLPRIRRTLEDIQENRPMIFQREEQEQYELGAYIEDCLKETEKRNFGYEWKVYANLAAVLLQIVRIRESKEKLPELREERDAGSLFFSALPEYIDAHSFESLQVQELAKKSGMSYSNFARVFKLQYGRSCKEYIEYIRVAKAEEMVLYGDMDMGYIAQETGFADASHFIRVYKKFKGETPKQARKRAGRGGKPLSLQNIQ